MTVRGVYAELVMHASEIRLGRRVPELRDVGGFPTARRTKVRLSDAAAIVAQDFTLSFSNSTLHQVSNRNINGRTLAVRHIAEIKTFSRMPSEILCSVCAAHYSECLKR